MSLNESSNLVGDIKLSSSVPVNYIFILHKLEKFMIEHNIEKIDVGWSRTALEKVPIGSKSCN